jgi:hypothetical protein
MYAPSLKVTFFKGYILGPKMVELGKVQILPEILGISFNTNLLP